ncbi:MAG: hypothetical protein COT73_00760 [Bdellovibrio sp. CG10_big_fil_rev_8_21_14_0_10_47_8]|nr:MAG: hypothetical protein COT73_00760 [Bdellovibrio sp. CG10_big_fil_rev_8_21_14_0_10_47_8]
MAYQILCMVGGISRNSLNLKLFRALEGNLSERCSLDLFPIQDLPFFSQDLEMDPPAIVGDFKERIEKSQALLFVTPEYNRSIPGVLKNAVDWGSRPAGKNTWARKPAGILGASAGNIGTFGAQQHLRQVLGALGVRVMLQPEIYLNGSKAFGDQGQLIDDYVKGMLQKYAQGYISWIQENMRTSVEAAHRS